VTGNLRPARKKNTEITSSGIPRRGKPRESRHARLSILIAGSKVKGTLLLAITYKRERILKTPSQKDDFTSKERILIFGKKRRAVISKRTKAVKNPETKGRVHTQDREATKSPNKRGEKVETKH